MKIIEQIQTALDSDMRADALDELTVELRMYTNATAARLKAITKRDGDSWDNAAGPERKRAIAAGDVDALRQMDSEEPDLVAELQVLDNLQRRLRDHLDAVRANEYAAAAPVRYSELGKLLAAEAKAKAALVAARKETESALRDLTTQRQHVARARHLEFPAADETLLRQLMQVRGWTYQQTQTRRGWFSPSGGPQQLQILANVLGVQVPRVAA